MFHDKDKKSLQSLKTNESEQRGPKKTYDCEKCGGANASHNTAEHKQCSYCSKLGHLKEECRKHIWDEKHQNNNNENNNQANSNGQQSEYKGKNAYNNKGNKLEQTALSIMQIE